MAIIDLPNDEPNPDSIVIMQRVHSDFECMNVVDEIPEDNDDQITMSHQDTKNFDHDVVTNFTDMCRLDHGLEPEKQDLDDDPEHIYEEINDM